MSQINYLIKLFKRYGGFIHKDLYTKFSKNSGWGFYSKKKLDKKEVLIKVPFHLTINLKDFSYFINAKRITYKHLDFLKLYTETIPTIEFFKNNHPCFCEQIEKDLMIQIVEKNSYLKNILINFFKQFEYLDNNEKFIFITFLTRSTTKINKEKVLMPILDMVNFNYHGKIYLLDDESVSIANDGLIEKNKEINCLYTDNMNPIEFFATWGFVPKDYKSFNIPNKSIFIEGLNNSVHKSSFIKMNNRYYFNEDLIFKKEQIPKNINNFLNIFPSKQAKKVFLEIMNSYEKSINKNLVDKILEERKCSKIILNFCESVKLYIENIKLYKLLLIL